MRNSSENLGLLNDSRTISIKGKLYTRLNVLGKGGSSCVYRIINQNDGQIFALKRVNIPHGEDSEHMLQTYTSEIALLKSLSSTNFATSAPRRIIDLIDYEINTADNSIQIILEAGDIDLNKVLNQGLLDPFYTRFVWREILEAVDFIHEQRIVHGDLKPANFVFVKGHIKLIDFGIAKSFTSDTTNIYRESQIGTINYMAPEAISPMSAEDYNAVNFGNKRSEETSDTDSSGKNENSNSGSSCEDGSSSSSDKSMMKMRLGRASDIWSLGCILYQMTYGRPPFAALNTIQKLATIASPKHVVRYPDTVSMPTSLLSNTSSTSLSGKSVASSLVPPPITSIEVPVDIDAVNCIKTCLIHNPRLRSTIRGPQGLLNMSYLQVHNSNISQRLLCEQCSGDTTKSSPAVPASRTLPCSVGSRDVGCQVHLLDKTVTTIAPSTIVSSDYDVSAAIAARKDQLRCVVRTVLSSLSSLAQQAAIQATKDAAAASAANSSVTTTAQVPVGVTTRRGSNRQNANSSTNSSNSSSRSNAAAIASAVVAERFALEVVKWLNSVDEQRLEGEAVKAVEVQDAARHQEAATANAVVMDDTANVVEMSAATTTTATPSNTLTVPSTWNDPHLTTTSHIESIRCSARDDNNSIHNNNHSSAQRNNSTVQQLSQIISTERQKASRGLSISFASSSSSSAGDSSLRKKQRTDTHLNDNMRQKSNNNNINNTSENNIKDDDDIISNKENIQQNVNKSVNCNIDNVTKQTNTAKKVSPLLKEISSLSGKSLFSVVDCDETSNNSATATTVAFNNPPRSLSNNKLLNSSDTKASSSSSSINNKLSYNNVYSSNSCAYSSNQVNNRSSDRGQPPPPKAAVGKTLPVLVKEQIEQSAQNKHLLLQPVGSDRAAKWMKPIDELEKQRGGNNMWSSLERRIDAMRVFLDVDQDQVDNTDTLDITGFNSYF